MDHKYLLPHAVPSPMPPQPKPHPQLGEAGCIGEGKSLLKHMYECHWMPCCMCVHTITYSIMDEGDVQGFIQREGALGLPTPRPSLDFL